MTTLPLLGFHFNVSFGDGQVFDDVSFSEVSVIDLEMLTKESCSMVNSEHLLSPSGFKYSDLELKRGKAGRESLIFKWLDIQVVNQKKLPITIIVNVLNHEHNPALTWTFTEAYPIKYQTSGLSANSKEVLIETITFKFTSYKVRQNSQVLPTPKPLNITTSSNRKSSRINRNTSQRKLDEVEKKPLTIKPANDKQKSSRISRNKSGRKLDEVEKKPLTIEPTNDKKKSSRVSREKSARKLDEVEKKPLTINPPNDKKKSSRVSRGKSTRKLDEVEKKPLNINHPSGKKKSSRTSRTSSTRRFNKD